MEKENLLAAHNEGVELAKRRAIAEVLGRLSSMLEPQTNAAGMQMFIERELVRLITEPDAES